MLYMLWKDSMPNDFYKFICIKENFSCLYGKNVLHPKVTYKKLRENLRKINQFFNMFTR